MPSGTDVSTAVQMIAPSMKLWNASPMRTSGTVAPCTWHSSVWQWREQHELLEDEERQDAGQQRAEDRRRAQRVSASRQQREQRDAEQRADGVADQPRDQRASGCVA